MKRLKQNWSVSSIRHIVTQKRTYILYTFLFVLFYFYIFSPFLVYEKAYLWSSDGMGQHYPSLIYTRQWLRQILDSILKDHTLKVPFWNLQLGFGQDVFGNAINFRPFNFLYVFFPADKIETYLLFRSFTSLYLCGIAFVFYARTLNKDPASTLLGSMIYVFSGFSLYFTARHPFFLEMMFYLPLLLAGTDRILEKRRSYLFIVIVFFSSISYFYFLYMVTIPAVIYALFRYFEVKNRTERGFVDFFKVLGDFIWQYAAGILLAAFSLLPSIIRSFGSSRTNIEQGINLLHWDPSYYANLYKGVVDVEQVGIYGFVMLSGISFFALLYLFFHKQPGKIKYIGQILIYSLTFLIPLFALVFSGFAGRTQRWCFIFSFWAAMAVTEMLPVLLKRNRRIYVISLAVVGLYMVGYYLLCRRTGEEMGSGCVWIVVYAAVLFLVNYTTVFQNRKAIFVGILLVCLCTENTIKSYELFSPLGDDYISEYADAGKLLSAGCDNPTDILKNVDDNSVYRVDSVVSPLSKKYNQMNYGLRNKVNGVSSYYSFSDGRICQTSLDLGNSQQNVRFLILDWDQRTGLNALSGVKYLGTTEAANEKLPYGYELQDSYEKTFSDGHKEMIYLYQNMYELPLMYTYDSYLSSDVYGQFEVNEKEQAMLQTVVLEDEVDFPEAEPEFDYQTLLDREAVIAQFRKAEAEGNIEVYDDHIVVKKNGAKVTLPTDEGYTGEIYWIMDDMNFQSKNITGEENWTPSNAATVSARIGNISNSCTAYNNTYQYYLGKRDFLINLGYGATTDHVDITFSRTGEYYFSDMKLVCQPMDGYAEKIARLKADTVTDINIDVNQISGRIETNDEKLLCVAVPYSSGWSATVNGVETKILPANGMYMAVELEKGENDVVLEYRTPGIVAGCAVSAVTFLALTIVIILIERRKRI